MNEKGIDSSKNETVKEEDKEEECTKKRKGGHIKMIARKKARKQSDINSDDEHKKCLKIVTFENWKIVTWRLYESCGVCILEFEDGIVIYMLVKRIYPLSKDLLQRMLDLGLEVERESFVALDLIRHKNWLVHEQMACGKDFSNPFMVDNLPKILYGLSMHHEALASPKANELTIPEQMATGKGTSNLFMAGSLPKITKLT
ncbi:hypothetical protein Tco_0104317 [Tanacetum coccineum]